MTTKKPDEAYVWISYSDMMTSVTFAFIFFLLCTMAELDHEKAKATVSTVSTVSTISTVSRERISALVLTRQELGSVLSNLREEVASKQECRGVTWTLAEDGISIRATFNDKHSWFRDGQSELSKEAEFCLNTFASLWLTKIYSNKSVKDNIQSLVIEGHTNSKGPENDKFLYNLKLSQDRALNAARYIIDKIDQKSFGIQVNDWRDFMAWRETKLTATGRSSAVRIWKDEQNKIEDIEQSKRIEFRSLITQDFEAMKNLVQEDSK